MWYRSESEASAGIDGSRLELASRVGRLGRWELDIASGALSCDDRWYRIMGRDSAQPIHFVSEFRSFIHPDDANRATEIDQTIARLSACDEDYSIEFRIVRPDGEVRWVRSMASLIGPDGDLPVRAVGFIADITEAVVTQQRLEKAHEDVRKANAALKRQKRRLEQLSLTDSLTGIANRRCFDREFARAWRSCRRQDKPLALALFDVDNFKEYNDHYGHMKGDAALYMISRVIEAAARRPRDLAARYGGEEFVLLLPDCRQLGKVLEKVRVDVEALQIEHCRSAAHPCLTVSIGGMTAWPSDTDRDALLDRSDKALYAAKDAGRNRVVVGELRTAI